MDFLAQPEQFKADLKDKWLDYYQENRSWLQQYMDEDSNWYELVDYEEKDLESFKIDRDYKPRRPANLFILGVINILEPSVKSLFTFMIHAKSDSEDLIKALGLDFDPELELQKRPKKSASDTQYLDQIREEIKT